MHIRKVKSACTIQRESLKVLLETLDIERYIECVDREKPLEFMIEVYYQMPLRECSLSEILDALVMLFKISNLVDTVEYTDDDDHYTLMITHDFGFNNSKMIQAVNDGLFRSYGVSADYIISDRSLFIKIYKTSIV